MTYKYLDAFVDEVVRVVYSADNTMRYVVLKDTEHSFAHVTHVAETAAYENASGL